MGNPFDQIIKEKNTEELLQIITNKNKWQPDAFNAALKELKKRKIKIDIKEINLINQQKENNELFVKELGKKIKKITYKTDILYGIILLVIGSILSFMSIILTEAIESHYYIVPGGILLYGVIKTTQGITSFIKSRG